MNETNRVPVEEERRAKNEVTFSDPKTNVNVNFLARNVLQKLVLVLFVVVAAAASCCSMCATNLMPCSLVFLQKFLVAALRLVAQGDGRHEERCENDLADGRSYRRLAISVDE